MSAPAEWDFTQEIVGYVELLAVDTTAGIYRFIIGADARLIDVNGNEWVGSQLISASEIEHSVNGSAPGAEYSFSFIQDPDEDDLIGAIRDMGGVDIVKGRDATMYMQYFATYNEMFKPVFAPYQITKRKMTALGYVFDGPQVRKLTLSVETSFNLRSKPIGARYTTADHSRRVGSNNPSLEFMPYNAFDEQTLFGL